MRYKYIYAGNKKFLYILQLKKDSEKGIKMAGKIPAPALDDAGTDFDDYKIRIDRWCQVSKVPKKHQALVIQGAMSKKPFGITKRIPMEVLKSDEGVKVLLKKLDEHYIYSEREL